MGRFILLNKIKTNEIQNFLVCFVLTLIQCIFFIYNYNIISIFIFVKATLVVLVFSFFAGLIFAVVNKYLKNWFIFIVLLLLINWILPGLILEFVEKFNIYNNLTDRTAFIFFQGLYNGAFFLGLFTKIIYLICVFLSNYLTKISKEQ